MLENCLNERGWGNFQAAPSRRFGFRSLIAAKGPHACRTSTSRPVLAVPPQPRHRSQSGNLAFSEEKIKPARCSLPITEANNRVGAPRGSPTARGKLPHGLDRRLRMFSARRGYRSPKTHHLRVYNGPSEDGSTVTVVGRDAPSHTVSVRLGEVLPLLADAVRSERTWLRDFEQDEITISTDLYEVILAYQYYRRPSA